MDFLKKIQTWLVGASTDVEDLNNRYSAKKEEYDNKTTRKVALITGIVVVVVAIGLHFIL